MTSVIVEQINTDAKLAQSTYKVKQTDFKETIKSTLHLLSCAKKPVHKSLLTSYLLVERFTTSRVHPSKDGTPIILRIISISLL